MKKQTTSKFDVTLKRFLKLKRKYDQQINSGSFQLLSQLEQSKIIKKLHQLILQLSGLKNQGRKIATTAACVALMAIGGKAQNYIEVTGTANPMDGFIFCGDTHPVFVDIDNDGDQDCFANYYNNMKYYENTGSSSSANFVSAPLSLTPVNSSNINAEFVDIDDDNDFDIVIADGPNYFWEYENTGTASAANFVTPTSHTTGLGYQSGNGQPAFADLDNDGDQDFICGSHLPDIYININTGTSAIDSWGGQTLLINYSWGSPELYDFDGDLDFDLFIGNVDGTIDYYENQGTITTHNFVLQTGTNNPFDGIDVGDYAYPVLVNIDGDPEPEAFVGNGTNPEPPGGHIIRFFDLPGGTPMPTAQFAPGDSTICPNNCITFSDNSSNAISHNWTFSGGTPASSSSSTPGSVCWDTPGVYEVKLVVTNPTGSDSTTTTVTVDNCDLNLNHSNHNDIEIFPNPAEDLVQIKLGNENKNVLIYDASGRLMKEINDVNGLLKVDVSSLNPGTYILHISNDKGIKKKNLIIK